MSAIGVVPSRTKSTGSESKGASADGKPDRRRAMERARSIRGFKDERGRSLYLHGPLKDLGRAGVGVELFFRTLRWTGIVFAIATVLGCISLAENARFNRDTIEHPVVRTTIGPCCKESASEINTWHGLPWFFTFVTGLVFLYFLRAKQRSIARLVDKRFITTNDYAVELRDLPLDTREHAIVAFCERFGKVAQVQIGYRCSEYVRHFNRWKKLDVELREARAQLAADPMPAGREAKIDALQAEMIDLEGLMARLQAVQPVSSGAAFVIFDTEAGRRACLRAHTLDWWQSLLELFGCAQTPRFDDAVPLRVYPAPEPSDVYWENLEVGPREVRQRSIVTLLVAALLIGASAAMLAVFTIEKDKEIARLTAESDGAAVLAFSQGIAIIAAAVVTGINSLLRIAVQYLTVYERRDTRTAYEEGLFVKLSMAYVINQSLLILLISPNVDTWFVAGGVYSQAFYIVLANAVVPEFLKIFRVDMLFKRFVMAPFAKSQAKFDELWMPPDASMGEFYAGLLKTLALGFLYGPGMPVVYFVTVAALVITYWASKYCLLRVVKQPPAMDEGVSERFRESLSFVLLISAILQLVIFSTRLPEEQGERESARLWPVVAIVLWVIYKVAPIGSLPCFAKYLDVKSNDTGGQPFSQMRHLPKYLCPISQPVPSIAADRQARTVEVRVLAEEPGSDGGEGEHAGGSGMPVALATLAGAAPRSEASHGGAGGSRPRPELSGAGGSGLQLQQVALSSEGRPAGAAGGGARAELPSAVATPAPGAPPPRPPQYESQYQQPYPPHGRQPASGAQALPVAQAYPAPQPAVAVRAPVLLSVVCPENAGPGAQLIVQGPSGELIMVTVPSATFPGMIFHVSA